MSTTALTIVGSGSSADELTQLVTFVVGGEEYGVEVLKVREIIRMPGITKMPNTPDFVEGIINLRGKVIPIVSMRKRFGLPETECNTQTRIMIMDVAGDSMGFIVDGVSEVLRVSGSEVQPAPTIAAGGLEQECIAGVISRPDRLLVVINADRIVSTSERTMLEA